MSQPGSKSISIPCELLEDGAEARVSRWHWRAAVWCAAGALAFSAAGFIVLALLAASRGYPWAEPAMWADLVVVTGIFGWIAAGVLRGRLLKAITRLPESGKGAGR